MGKLILGSLRAEFAFGRKRRRRKRMMRNIGLGTLGVLGIGGIASAIHRGGKRAQSLQSARNVVTNLKEAPMPQIKKISIPPVDINLKPLDRKRRVDNQMFTHREKRRSATKAINNAYNVRHPKVKRALALETRIMRAERKGDYQLADNLDRLKGPRLKSLMMPSGTPGLRVGGRRR